MFSFLSKSSVGNIPRLYCDYFYFMALFMIFNIAVSTLGLMYSVYRSVSAKGEKVTRTTYIGFTYATIINTILFINFSLLFTMCRNSITN